MRAVAEALDLPGQPLSLDALIAIDGLLTDEEHHRGGVEGEINGWSDKLDAPFAIMTEYAWAL